MKFKLMILALLVVIITSPALGWGEFTFDLRGIPLDDTISRPADGDVPVFSSALGRYVAGSGSSSNMWGGAYANQSAGFQKIAVPMYIYPGADWTTVGAQAPKVGFVVMNPNSGPGVSSDPGYVAQVPVTQALGISVIGYVDTNYAARSLATVEAEIDLYYTWYSVDGVFLDRVSTSSADTDYYTSLYQYVKAKTGLALVVQNPGTNTIEAYAATCDTMCSFEGDYATYASYSPSSWMSKYAASKFWHIVYDCSSGNLEAAITHSKETRAGYLYATDDVLPNPFDTIPSYFADEAIRAGYRDGQAKIKVSDIDSTGATNGQVITADGSGGSWWLTPSGGGGGSGVVGFFGKSKGVSLNGTPTTIDVDEGLTAVSTGAGPTYRITPTYTATIQDNASTASAGVANTFARGDHVHKGVLQVQGQNGITVNGADATNASGSLTITPTYGSPVSVAGSNSAGVANTFARSDHQHTIASDTITNAMVNSAAAIAYSKLALTASIVNADVAVGAAIAYAKLALSNSIVNGDISASAAIAYSKLALTGSIVNADVSASAAVAYSKLNLTGGIVNADVNASAAVAYSKLNLSNSVVVADIASSAKTGTGTKLATDTSPTINTPIFKGAVNFQNAGGTTNSTLTCLANGSLQLEGSGKVTVTASAANTLKIESGTVATDNVTSASAGALNLYSGGGNTDIDLRPSGTGNVENTGTGRFKDTNLSANGVVYADSNKLLQTTAVGTSGQVLTSNGAGVAPTFQDSGAGVFTATATSGEQTLSSGGLITWAHGLGSAPTLIKFKIRCKTTQNNWSVGDEVEYFPMSGISARIPGVYSDATNVYVRLGSDALCLTNVDKNSGATAGTTNGNWRLLITVWK